MLEQYRKEQEELARKLSLMELTTLITYTLNRQHCTTLERELAERLRDLRSRAGL